MDRNAPDYIYAKKLQESAGETLEWIKDVLPQEVPKYPSDPDAPASLPSCTDALMEELKKLQMPLRRCLFSPTSRRIRGRSTWVKELCPWAEFYGDVVRPVRAVRRGLPDGDGALCVQRGAGDLNG